MVRTKLEEASQDPTISKIFDLVPAAKDEAVVEALLQDKALREALQDKTRSSQTSAALKFWSRVKVVALIWLLYVVMLPISLAGMAAAIVLAFLRGQYRRGSRIASGTRGTALVSGGNKGKCLAIVRHLHKAGWRVVLVEVDTAWSCGTRFSTCVSAFYTTPRPNTDPVKYLKAIEKIARKEKVNMWFPVSMAQYSIYEALACSLMPPNTICCTTNPHMTALLNDKNVFTDYARKLGLAVPEAFPVTSKEQLLNYNNNASKLFKGKRFLLKSVAYEAISRADLFTLPCNPQVLLDYVRQFEISEHNPWILQQFLEGPEYSCYSVAHDGHLLAHVDNQASLSCLRYQHVGLPEIQNWVKDFCSRTGASGQLCFDFMYDRPGGKIYCIEANPRTSTNLLAFHNHPDFGRIFSEPQAIVKSGKTPLLPLRSSKQSYWIWNEIGEAVFGQVPSLDLLKQARITLRRLLAGRDAVFEARDPLPFLALHFLQEPTNLWRVFKDGTPWVKLDLCSGKVVCLGGD